jgi:four helix bundle protein
VAFHLRKRGHPLHGLDDNDLNRLSERDRKPMLDSDSRFRFRIRIGVRCRVHVLRCPARVERNPAGICAACLVLCCGQAVSPIRRPAGLAGRSPVQACDYRLCGTGELARHKEPRDQLRSAVAKPPALIAEAYGRFNSLDSARLLTQAKAELLESQNHLIDAFDKQFITEAVRVVHHKMAQEVIGQVDGWRDYLQSEEAQRKVKEIRERRKRSRKFESEFESESRIRVFLQPFPRDLTARVP